MKKGFTIIEVSILFVIFLIVAFLVAPFSVDDTIQAKNTSRWRDVQADFTNIFNSVMVQNDKTKFKEIFISTIRNEAKKEIKPYKISYLNGTRYQWDLEQGNALLTYSNSTIFYKFFPEQNQDILGNLIYDVNGTRSPNVWGRDVFGFNIYEDRLEPLGKTEKFIVQKSDCSRSGTGTFCSNYYLIGGSFD